MVFSILSGILIGSINTLFYKAMFVTGARTDHPWLICLLPAGGLVIVGSYYLLHVQNDAGTNLVHHCINS